MVAFRTEEPDGRAIDVWDGGDPSGRPVVMFHGTPGSRRMAAHADEAARAHGVRLLAFSRPGYGASSPAPPSLATVARDACRVVDHAGADRFAVLGVSGGGPFAAATAAVAGDRVEALAVAGGVGPWRVVDPPEDDDPERALLERAEREGREAAVPGLDELFEEHFGALRAIPDDLAMAEAFLSAAPAGESRDDPGYRARWAADLREALASPSGYAFDCLTIGLTWDVDISAVRQPTLLSYGADDVMVPPRHGAWYAERIPHARLVVRPGEGHGATTLGHWSETFSALAP